jgi:hypothetical protein
LVDYVVYGALIVTLAAFFTLHVWLAAALLGSRPRWRAAAAFFVAPLAPVYGWKAGRKKLAIAWLAALAAYAIARVVAAAAA